MTIYRTRRGVDYTDICRLAGVPWLVGLMGNVFFLDPVNGNDSHPGTRPDKAFKTMAVAYAALTANQHDVLIYIANSSGLTLGSDDSYVITWAKNYTHLIGACAPTQIAQRSRIFTTAGQDVTPMVTVSATGCVWANIYMFHGLDSSDSEVCCKVSGGRNYFHNVHFAGIGHATQGDDTGAVSLQMSGAEENTFRNCTIGVDTIARSVANTEIKFDTQAKRNQFIDCTILAYADNAGHYFVNASAAASDVDRFNSFENCKFINTPNVGSMATMTTAFKCHASLSGSFLLRNCTLLGATDWDGDTTGRVFIDGAAPTNNTSGLAVAVA